jgi:hypothetical protein
MKTLFYAIMLYQICGNDIVYIKNGAPYAVCNMVNRDCEMLSDIRLILIRETSSCSRLKKFNIME